MQYEEEGARVQQWKADMNKKVQECNTKTMVQDDDARVQYEGARVQDEDKGAMVQ